MKNKHNFCLSIELKNEPPRLEVITAKNEITAHHSAHKKYGEQYAGSCILEDTPQNRLVYIASPYAGDIESNTRFAVRCCQYAIKRGYTPLASHLLYPQMLDDSLPEERALGLAFGQTLLALCREMWVFGAHISSGMACEIDYAREHGIQIRYIADPNQD